MMLAAHLAQIPFHHRFPVPMAGDMRLQEGAILQVGADLKQATHLRRDSLSLLLRD